MPALASSKDGEYTATPVVGEVRDFTSLQLRLSPEEVSSVFTVPLTTLIEPANHGYTQFRAGSRGWSLPVFHGQVPHVIWGLTAIMTAQLLRALLPTSLYRHQIHYQSPIAVNKK